MYEVEGKYKEMRYIAFQFCSAGGILHYCNSQEDLKVCGPDTWQTNTEVGDKITKILSSVSFVLSFEIKKKKKKDIWIVWTVIPGSAPRSVFVFWPQDVSSDCSSASTRR